MIFYVQILTQSVVYEDVLLLGLHQERSLLPDVGQEGLDVDLPLGPQLLQHGVDDDVGPGPADPGTAVDQQWSVLSLEKILKVVNQEKTFLCSTDLH